MVWSLSSTLFPMLAAVSRHTYRFNNNIQIQKSAIFYLNKIKMFCTVGTNCGSTSTCISVHYF